MVNPKFALLGAIFWMGNQEVKETSPDGTVAKYKNKPVIVPVIGFDYGVNDDCLIGIQLSSAKMESDLEVEGAGTASLEREVSSVKVQFTWRQ